MFGCAENLETAGVRRDVGDRELRDAFLVPQVLCGERRAVLEECGRRAEEDHLAAALPRSRPDVEHPVGGEHDLRVVLHYEQGVAGVAQSMQHVDHAAHVARVQPDARFVEHEEGIDERGAERRGEIDALHFAPAQGSRLAIESEVAEAYAHEIAQAGADLVEEEGGSLVHRRRQMDQFEEAGAGVDRQQYHVVDRESGQLAQARFAQRAAGGPKAGRGAEGPTRVGGIAHAPVEGRRLEAGAAAVRAGSVGAVLREQHPDVHLVALGLEPVEEAAHPVPHLLAPSAFALDHPAAVARRQASPGAVDR